MDPMQNLNNAAEALNQVAQRGGAFWDDADQRLDQHGQRVDDLVTNNEHMLNGVYTKLPSAQYISGRFGWMGLATSQAANGQASVGYALWRVPDYAAGHRYRNIGFLGDAIVYRDGYTSNQQFQLRARATYSNETNGVRLNSGDSWVDADYGVSFETIQIDGFATRIIRMQMVGAGVLLFNGMYQPYGTPYHGADYPDIRHQWMGYSIKSNADGSLALNTDPNRASPMIRAAFGMEQV